MTAEKKPRSKDTTSGARVASLRERTVRMPEVHLTPEAYAEVEAMLAAGEATGKTDLMRRALHEKYLRFAKQKS